MPTGRVWRKDTGWIKKQTELDASYDNLAEGWPLLITLFRLFPDFMADTLWSDTADFRLGLIQRLFLRINARYQYVDITACRGATKSFCLNLEKYESMVLWPGIVSTIVGPSFKQSAKIASQIYKQIDNCAPMLTSMLSVDADGVDRFAVSTDTGSKMSVEAFRGNTVHDATAEESAQEEAPPFDSDQYKEVVIPAIRGEYRSNGKRAKAYIRYKQHSITSAGRRQQYAYETRHNHRRLMARGESAFIVDVPFGVLLLEQMRPLAWAENIRNELTPAQWMREMESIYSGSDKNPIIRDEVLTESRCLLMMEQHHCCKDRDNKLKPEDVIYIVANDVSYRDAKGNAKNACIVLKLTKQDDYYHRDKYLKQCVWVEDWTPAETPTPRARGERIRRIWDRYTYEGSATYLAIDAWQVGDDVVKALMEDPGGGRVPLCIYRHMDYTDLELQGAIPVIYPIRAGGIGTTDPDSDMILNAELQFEHGNVQLLTGNMNEGVEAYKKFHRIKDDSMNYQISQPYKKTTEMVGQIQNLREEPSGQGIREKRITKSIQRDSWSALKYGLRLAQVLERANLVAKQNKSDWSKLLAKYKGIDLRAGMKTQAKVQSRTVTTRNLGKKL